MLRLQIRRAAIEGLRLSRQSHGAHHRLFIFLSRPADQHLERGNGGRPIVGSPEVPRRQLVDGLPGQGSAVDDQRRHDGFDEVYIASPSFPRSAVRALVGGRFQQPDEQFGGASHRQNARPDNLRPRSIADRHPSVRCSSRPASSRPRQ